MSSRKTALVTGAAVRIGAETARTLDWTAGAAYAAPAGAGAAQ